MRQDRFLFSLVVLQISRHSLTPCECFSILSSSFSPSLAVRARTITKQSAHPITSLDRDTIADHLPASFTDVKSSSSSSVIRNTVSIASVPAWKQLLPPGRGLTSLVSPPQLYGIDVRIEWNVEEETCDEAAQRWLNVIFSQQNKRLLSLGGGGAVSQRALLQDELAASMQSFVSYCQTHLSANQSEGETKPPVEYTGRIVASRGPRASIKCPQWHLDHVPVRWIQALVGPSVEWVHDNSHIQWDKINALKDDDWDDLSVPERNRRLVNETGKITTIKQQAKEGEAVMLIGKTWYDWARPEPSDESKASRSSLLSPVVHKSPYVSPWQGRVLLTMDVKLPVNEGE